MPKRKGYGKIEFVDKRKLKHDGWDDQIEPEFRKPTPEERREIILNYIRTHNHKPLRLDYLAEAFNVSERTIQTDLRKIEANGLIIRIPRHREDGRDLPSAYDYTGEDLPLPPDALTLRKLYNPDNPCGFRDWDWEEFKFIPGYFDENFTRKDQQLQSMILKSLKRNQAEKKEKLHKKK